MFAQDNVDLLELIASKRSIAFIGTGPSCEMGYPSWRELAEQVVDKAIFAGFGVKKSEVIVLMQKQDYARVLDYCASRISRDFVCAAIKESLVPAAGHPDTLYRVLCSLPFACYLTTNYDDEIIKHLVAIGKTDFKCVQNQESDFNNFSDDMEGFVFKIHGDMEHPDNAVVTSGDYHDYTHSPEREYFRKRLQMLLGMKKCVFVGYSLADKDVSFLIEQMKAACSEANPGYILLPNVSKFEIEAFRRDYGVRVIGYKADGDDHSDLVSKLSVCQKFIHPKASQGKRISVDAERGAQLYMFRKLRGGTYGLDFTNYILLSIPTDGGYVSVDALRKRTNIHDCNLLKENLSALISQGLVTERSKEFCLTKDGQDLANRAKDSYLTEKKFAIDDFTARLMIPSDEKSRYGEIAEKCIIGIFEKRGQAIANSLFAENAYTQGALIDIYQFILCGAEEIDDAEIRIRFAHAMHDFLVSPSLHQRKYLGAIAQGYFMYHMMGNSVGKTGFLDALFMNTRWYLDSNILIRLVAKGCAGHDFIVDMFQKLKGLGAKIVVLPKVVDEVRQHLIWAEEHIPQRRDFVKFADQTEGGQINCFIDGYINLSSQGTIRSFEQYLSRISINPRNNSHDFCRQYGLTYDDSQKPTATDREWQKEILAKVQGIRKLRGSYRHEFQVETDAYLLWAMQKRKQLNESEGSTERVCFLSQSNLFYQVDPSIDRWSSEAMYRFVQTLVPKMSSDESLQDCLVNELYASGIDFINKKSYTIFFKEDIDAAELTFDNQKKEFLEYWKNEDLDSLEAAFKNLSTLQKPMFVHQMQKKIEASLKAELSRSGEALRIAQSRGAEAAALMEEKDNEIERLRAEIKRREASLLSANNTIRNLEDKKRIEKRLRKLRNKHKKH